jgi:predicted lipid-binding transport protein (Tim44 family)
MKIRYIIGSVMVASVVGLLLFFQKNESVQGSYDKKDLSTIKNQNANEALEWINARYIDEETGERIQQKSWLLLSKI